MRPRWIAALLFAVVSAAEAAMQVEVVRMIARPADVGSRTSTVVSWLVGKRDPFLFDRPYAVAWDGDALLVADPGARRVLRIDGSRVVTTSDDALEEPVGVAVCAQGIIVTDSLRGEVVLFDRNLRKVRVLSKDIDRPTGVVCRGDDIFFVATGEHRVVALNGTGGVAAAIGSRGDGPSQFNFPAAITLGDSSLFVGDTLNFRVQQIDVPAGTLRAQFGGLGDAAGDTPRIKGLAVDAKGRLWVSDAHLDRLSVFGANGNLVATVGGPGADGGQFSFPAGVAIASDGRIAVADSLNRRIQILRVRDGVQP